eukprot:TRINITY_DN1772_c6_g1_i1.p1 TRINITY_DN1772_c6_g1~~TRINITY_DN1772_c6_g1_i1.p1  ORF type:complete len:355 (+),score=91.02 TRINITY_DN1772_c6_g1_i1:68-1066(+)
MLKDMPKVELHAHLGGSVREATLRELMQAKGLSDLQFTTACGGDGQAEDRMHRCFKLFDAVGKVTDTLRAIKRIAREVVVDYAMENTKFLELRTSLKALEGTTEREYLEAVLQGMEEGKASLPPTHHIETSLLVSINRGLDPSNAASAIKHAEEYFNKGVRGIDFSGNCYKNTFKDFLPHLQKARMEGIPITLHAGEKEDSAELHEMIDFAPERLGHFVYTDKKAEVRVRDAKIPIEMCLTSNLITAKWSIEDHHITSWLDHPISINCDDRGIFGITHTSEFELLQTLDHVPDRTLFDISKGSVEQAFITAEEKRELRKYFDEFEASHAKDW